MKIFSFISAAVFCFLFLAACFSPWQGNQGSFNISLVNGNNRALLNRADFETDEGWNWLHHIEDRSELWHVIKLKGPEKIEQKPPVQYGETVHFSVMPGDWEINIKVYWNKYSESVLVAEGSVSVNIHPGPNGNIIVPLHEPTMPEYLELRTGIITGQADFSGYNNRYGMVYLTSSVSVIDYPISGIVPCYLESGETITLRAEPNTGYHFVKWVSEDTINGMTISSENPHIFTLDEEIEIYAVFDGDGTRSNPWNIAAANELQNMEMDKSYRLMTDLNLSGTGEIWNPIGIFPSLGDRTPFNGNFDGNFYTINLDAPMDVPYVGGTGFSYCGLFGAIGNDSTVQNLRLKGTIPNVSTNGILYAGPVAGENAGIIKNVASAVEVITNSAWAENYTGGIAGTNSGTIENCSNTGSITAIINTDAAVPNGYAGGITGINNTGGTAGTIRNCYSTGNIMCDTTGSGNYANSYAGGIAGDNSYGEISCCWATGKITTSTNTSAPSRYECAGGIAGSMAFNGPITECVALNSELSNSMAGNTGRILGYTFDPTQISRNFAKSDMTVNGAVVSATDPDAVHNGIHGAGIPYAEYEGLFLDWWSYTDNSGPGWHINNGGYGGSESSPWVWNAEEKRPVLWFED